MPGRLITDNVLVAYEALHTMHGKKKGKIGTLAMKLDISKAYDKVEWVFFFLKKKKDHAKVGITWCLGG